MKVHKIRKIIREQLKIYSCYEKIIVNLENSKNTTNKKDINSFIKSKNSVSCSTEIQAIKNIGIDEKISEIAIWKEIIDYVFEECEKECKYKKDALEYRFIDNLSIDTIAEIVHISPTALKNWINDFIIEVAFIAISNKVLKIEKV